MRIQPLNSGMEKIETRLDDRLMCSIVEYLALAVIGAPQNVKCFHCAASDAVGPRFVQEGLIRETTWV